MRTEELINEIKKLPVSKRIYVIEKAFHSIREKEENEQMQIAADILLDDYRKDREHI